MNSGTTTSLVCPACGQAFLSMQQSMEGMVQCPHCAHNAPRGYFGAYAQVAAVAQVKRRTAQPNPAEYQPPPATQPYAPDPGAYAHPSAWQGPPQVAPGGIARQMLQPSQALQPVGAPSPAPEEFVPPPHLRSSAWRNALILLAFTAVCSLTLWLWWDSVNAPAVQPGAAASAKATVPVVPMPVQPQVARAQFPPPDTTAIAADAKALVTELFAADTAARRAACIHEAEKYSAEIEALFGGIGATKTELRLLARISGMPLLLPSGQPSPVFRLVTSTCANGALIRLETGTDGKRRIFWPLLYETHAAKLEAFFKQAADETGWFHVGMRPSHGLDIPAELRPKYLTFDVQVSAGGEPHFVACVERETPLGRFLDRETDWGRAYLTRLLVRKLDIQADAPCLLVIDCEGAPER